MALAKYFSKDLLAINQLLKSNNKNLEDILLKNRIGIAFDLNAINTKEGNKALDLSIRLLSRLYPCLSIIDLTKQNKLKVQELIELAKNINSNIDISIGDEDLTVLLIAGTTKHKIRNNVLTLYYGSDNWNVFFSQNRPQVFKDSDNSIGCGITACIAVSNVFRFVFRDYLSEKKLDSDLTFSTLNYSVSETFHNPDLERVNLTDVVLVGVGAIGNGCIWALSNLSNLRGNFDIVDNENISLSNLQRYVMFCEEDVNSAKVDLAVKEFRQKKLKVSPYKLSWAGYLKRRNNWNIEIAAVSIDNKKDRIGIQSSLPKIIINSYTESNLLGIARHYDFINSACLACGYIPSQKEKNFINEVADNCNIPSLAHAVKDYINLDLTVDAISNPQNTSSLLDIIAQANNIERSKLIQFHGKKVNEFYSEFICGGISLSLSSKDVEIQNIDAPLAFQSTMAGILLAAEIVIHANKIRTKSIKQQSHLYPLNALGQNNPFNHQLSKDNTGRCLCMDSDFKDRYQKKYCK